MSEQTSKTVIGGFVIGALVIAVIGVLVLGSGKFFQKTDRYVVFFEGSQKGLDVGSPVVFRGVRIGTVSKITLRFDSKTSTTYIPVLIEIEPDRFEVEGPVIEREPGAGMRELINNGMRAQLLTESLVTGSLMVALDFFPDTPIKLVGKEPGYIEIPTIPSPIEEFAKEITQLPIQELFAKLIAAVDAIKELAENPEIGETIHTIKLSMDDVRSLVENIDRQVDSLAASAKETIGDYGHLAKNVDKEVGPLVSDARTAIKDYDKLARNIDRRVGPLFADVSEAVKSANSALKRAENAIKSIQDQTSDKSVMANELRTALRELSSASRSIRVWADYLERHPEALIYGKGGYRR